MNERLREALRRQIAAHNRLVSLSIVWSVLGVALMWAALYFVARWLAVLGATVVKGVDAIMPERFDQVFGIAALALIVAGVVARRLGFHRRLREEKSVGFTLIELCLLPASATLATVENLGNHIRLSGDDLQTAADFLTRVVRAGRLATTSIPLELPEERSRDRVLRALELLDLIYLRHAGPTVHYAVADPQRLLRFL